MADPINRMYYYIDMSYKNAILSWRLLIGPKLTDGAQNQQGCFALGRSESRTGDSALERSDPERTINRICKVDAYAAPAAIIAHMKVYP